MTSPKSDGVMDKTAPLDSCDTLLLHHQDIIVFLGSLFMQILFMSSLLIVD